MCQVNTDPMRSRQGYLQVVVPPSIIDKETSSDMVVLESTNVSLTCKATGYPEPYVMWRREDGEDIRYNGENEFVIGGVYIPPKSPREIYSRHCQTAESLVLQYSSYSMFVFGDYNLPNAAWDNDEYGVLVNCPGGDPAVDVAQAFVYLKFFQNNNVPNNRNVFLDLVFSNVRELNVIKAGDPLVDPSLHHVGVGNVPPMLSIPNQLEGAYVGQDVTLECRTEAFPTSINYWTTERGDMIISGDKYEAVSMDNGYKKYMMLKIRRVTKIDFGSYKCVAKNSLGETDGVIKLEEIPAPTTVKTTTHLATPVAKKGNSRGSTKGTLNDNRVNSVGKADDSSIADYDYDSEYTLPSNGPPPIQEPPGAFSGASRNFSSGGVVVFCFFLSILFFFFASAAAASSDEGPR
uniref:Neuronal cell adhesion molecule-like n=1 Tax=Diabrotica virgifera virgifera TaxID=50390 RepID=A0A6P7FC37_DIAVI